MIRHSSFLPRPFSSGSFPPGLIRTSSFTTCVDDESILCKGELSTRLDYQWTIPFSGSRPFFMVTSVIVISSCTYYKEDPWVVQIEVQ